MIRPAVVHVCVLHVLLLQRTWAGGNGQFWWGLASTQGRRDNMVSTH